MEDIKEMLSAQSSNSTYITPYEGLDVHHNSTEGIKLKRSRDEYEGVGASGEGNSKSLTMSHTQRGLKDRELMYGLMLILIARILMKVSHLYKDSVASYWAYGNLFFFFFCLEKVGDDTKESSLSTILFTGHLKSVSFFFWVKMSLPLLVS